MRQLIAYTIEVENAQAKAALTETERVIQSADAAMKKLGVSADEMAEHQRKAAALTTAQLDKVTSGVSTLDKEYAKAKASAAQLGQETTKQAGMMDSALASLGRRIIAVFAVERIVSFGVQVINTAGHVQDLSDKTGLSTTAIQKLGYAASLSGSNIDQVANSIAAMSKNLVGGNAGAVAAMNQLGLSQQALLRMKPEEAFLAIADGIRKVEDPMRQADLAMKAFGASGKDILPAIKAGFREAGEEAERLGAVMSEQTVKDLDELGDTWAKVWAGMQGWTARVLVTVLEVGRGLKEIATQALPGWMQSAAGAVGTTAGNLAAAPFSFTGAAIDQWRAQKALWDWESGKTPGAQGEAGGLGPGGAYRPASLADLLAIEIPPPVIQSRRTLTHATRDAAQATREAAAANEAYLRSLMPTIGVNQRLLNETYARYGVAGLSPGFGDVPGMPSAAYAVGLPSDAAQRAAYMGWRNPGYGQVPQQPVGFWRGAGGTAASMAIGMGGSMLMGQLGGDDPWASTIGGAASGISGAALAGMGMSGLALGAATMGIGAAAIGIYMLIKHYSTVSKEVKQARADVRAFEEQLWQTMTPMQRTEAAGQDWAATIITVRDAYERMGLSAAQAEADVLQLWDTDNPERAREAMFRINETFQAFRDLLAETNTELRTLLGQAAQIGQRLPADLLAQLQALQARGDLAPENVALLEGLLKAPDVDYRQFQAAAQRYNINQDALGRGFQQFRTNTTAQQMIDDVDLLLRGGADMGTILHGMREELSGLVQDALKFGTTLPENMRPWIEELQRSGQLVDENGQALKDLSTLQWGDPLKTSFQELIDQIKELIALLKGDLPAAVDQIPKEKNIEINITEIVDRRTLPVDRGGSTGDGEYLADGGVVYAAAGWPKARGTDVVPAMLTPGEGILSRRGMAALGALNRGEIGGSGIDARAIGRAMVEELDRRGGLRPVVQMDTRVVTEQIVPHIHDVMEYQGITGPVTGWR